MVVSTKVIDKNIFYFFCAWQGGNETTKRVGYAPLAGVPITKISVRIHTNNNRSSICSAYDLETAIAFEITGLRC